MDVSVLGTMAVVGDDGQPRALGGEKQRGVLAMLALEPNVTVGIDRLAEGVWGELVPDRYVQNLQVYVSTLRRILEPSRTAAMPSRIASRGAGYELIVADDELDLSRFRTRANAGVAALEARQPATAAEALRSALSDWRGDPLSDLIDLPFFAEATRALHEEWCVVFEQCIEAELDNGRAGDLVPELEQALVRAPTRERTWEHLVVALYRGGRQAEALNACQRARDLLLDEFGLDPGPRLRAVEQQVLEQSSVLDAPLRAAVRVAPVPVPLSSLVGRDSVVADVADRLDDHRVVVLTGPGGIGKTRVALAVAAAASDRGRAVYFADLSAERDPSRVVAALARPAGLADGAAVSEVAAALEGSGALLVVDNFEQVVDAADVVATIASLAPAARVLVTSRIRLGIPGEHVVEVEPLSAELTDGPATQLFWDRALEVEPRLRPDDHAAAGLAIARALDGMPLAIELAASRVTIFDPSELARRVTEAVDTIVDVGTDRRRHGSLRAAIRWSTELLSSDELTLFGVLSVCESSVDLATVVALAGGADLAPAVAERALEGLVRASLVRPQETSAGRRYGYLATTRAVARASLPETVDDAVRAVHARWFARRAWELIHGADTGLVAAADLPESVAAMRWVAAHGEPALATALLGGLFTVTLVLADRFRYVHSLAVELLDTSSLPKPFAARASVVAGILAYMEGDDAAAADLLPAVADLDADDHFFRARGSMQLAALSTERSVFDEARRFAADARHHADLVGVPRLVGLAWSVSSYVALKSGDAEDALACAQTRLAVETPGGWGEASATIDVAHALLALDRADEAAEHSRTGLVLAQRLGLPMVQGNAFRCMAWCALAHRDPATAAACLLEQVAIFDRTDAMTDRVAETSLTAALAAALGGRMDTARSLWASGQLLIKRLGLSTHDLPPAVVDLADRFELEGGDAISDTLSVVTAAVVSTLRDLCNSDREGASDAQPPS